MQISTPSNIFRTSTTALRSVMLALVLASGWLCNVRSLSADQAQYFYDELGRLVGVVDGQNNAAVYSYDAVGNLLKIDRFTSTGGNVGIFFFTPSSSVVSKPVEIRGFGYTSPPSSNQVAVNGTLATVVSGTASSLIITVPSGATTGPITVTNMNGIATSPQVFTVLVPPIITGVAPLKVPQGIATRVLIQGFNLGTATGVQFTHAGLSATIMTGATETVLPINLAVGSTVPAGFYAFTVTTPGGTAQSGTMTIEVKAALPSYEIAPPVSVYHPFPPSLPPPPGPSMTVAPPVSVAVP
jgi:YD repeat-containing protein